MDQSKTHAELEKLIRLSKRWPSCCTHYHGAGKNRLARPASHKNLKVIALGR